jgi:hypothetical protein
MSKLLRDNAFALSLGGCCLALSGWIYLNEGPSPNPAVAAAPQAAEQERTSSPVGRRPQVVAAQDVSRAAAKKDGPAAPGNQPHDPAANQLDGLHLSPADWQP